MLYLIFCKCPELVSDLENIHSARRDLNGQITQLPHSIEVKVEMQRGKCLVCTIRHNAGTRAQEFSYWIHAASL